MAIAKTRTRAIIHFLFLIMTLLPVIMLRKSSGCASDQAVNGIATFLKFVTQIGVFDCCVTIIIIYKSKFESTYQSLQSVNRSLHRVLFRLRRKNKKFFLSKTLYLVRILTKMSIYRGSIFITKVFEKILRKPLQYKDLCGIIIRHDCGKWGKYARNTIC